MHYDADEYCPGAASIPLSSTTHPIRAVLLTNPARYRRLYTKAGVYNDILV